MHTLVVKLMDNPYKAGMLHKSKLCAASATVAVASVKCSQSERVSLQY